MREEFEKAFHAEIKTLESFFYSKIDPVSTKYDRAIDAMDLAQQTGILAFINLHKWHRDNYTLKSFIWLVARNILSRHVRPAQRRLSLKNCDQSSNVPSQDPTIQKQLEDKETFDKITEFIGEKQLSSLMEMEEGKTTKEIADKLNISEENFRQRLSRMRKEVRKNWPNRNH